MKNLRHNLINYAGFQAQALEYQITLEMRVRLVLKIEEWMHAVSCTCGGICLEISNLCIRMTEAGRFQSQGQPELQKPPPNLPVRATLTISTIMLKAGRLRKYT